MREGKGREFHTVRGYQMIADDVKGLTSAMEDYLEMIYRNCYIDGYTRINRLADMLNVQASSATKMVQKLAASGYVNYERYGIVRLTEKGRKAGSFLLDRHKTIEKFLKNLGVRKNILKDTELIEHNISRETLRRIELFNQFLEKEPAIREKLSSLKPEKN